MKAFGVSEMRGGKKDRKVSLLSKKVTLDVVIYTFHM